MGVGVLSEGQTPYRNKRTGSAGPHHPTHLHADLEADLALSQELGSGAADPTLLQLGLAPQQGRAQCQGCRPPLCRA